MYTGTATFDYRLDGLIGSRAWPNGETATFAYDAAKRPTGIALTGSKSINQTYDRDGNVTSESRSLGAPVTGDNGGGTNTFTYDALDRLQSETGLAAGNTRSYQYDLDGNRRAKVEGLGNAVTFTYDRTDQLIDQTGGAAIDFTYNAYGDLTGSVDQAGAAQSYAYDTASRMRSMTAGGSTATFTFDAVGRNKTWTVGALTEDYGYVGGTETVWAIVGGTSRISAVSPDGARIATKQAGTTTAYLLPDLHGNLAAAEASGSTTITNAIRYDGYGQTLGTPYTAGSPITLDTKYQGRLDVSPSAGFALYDLSARNYSPTLGTFSSLDSVMGSPQDPRSMNRFLYAFANPATLIDPTGHHPVSTSCDTSKYDNCSKSNYNGSNGVATNDPKAASNPINKPSLANAQSTTKANTKVVSSAATPAVIVVIPTTPENAPPGPAPCGGGTMAQPCTTPHPGYPSTPVSIDPAQAALIACSMAAPPPAQVTCDAQQFGQAVSSGDPVEIVANGLGFIWYIGDAAKYVIKGGKAVLEVDPALRAVRLLESGRPPNVIKNHLDKLEEAQAWEVARFRGGTFVGQEVPFKAGIDGTFEGVPVSLKRTDMSNPKNVLAEVKVAQRKAKTAGYTGVDVYVSATRIDSRAMAVFADNGGLVTMHQRGIIADIYIQTRDAWVIIKGS